MRTLLHSVFRQRIARVLLTALLATPAMLTAQDAVTSAAGGDGGDAFTLSCGAKAMVGIQGRWQFHVFGYFVDYLQPLCVSVNTGGAWIGTPTPTSGSAGVIYEFANPVTVVCPSGAAISGFAGQSGSYVDRFQIYCTYLGEYGKLSGSATEQPTSIGGDYRTGPALFGPYMCPDNKPGKGLTGKAHDWIDRLALICNVAPTPPAGVAFMSLNPKTVVGGNSVNGAVTLNAHAPSGGTTVGVSVQILVADEAKIPPNPIAVSPFTIPAGTTDGSFVFHTIPVSSSVNVRLNIGAPTALITDTFRIVPPSLAAISLGPNRTKPGLGVTGTVSLNGAAPSGGVSVNLTSNVPVAATVPTTVVVPQGQSSTTFPVTVPSTGKSGCSVIAASGVFALPGTPLVRQAVLAVSAPANTAYTLSMTSVLSASGPVTVTYPTVVKARQVLTIVSSNPALVSAPSTVSVPVGAASADFTIALQGLAPSGANCAVVTVTDAAGNVNAVVLQIDGSAIKRIG